ncbi:MAG TPA: carboxypeptidase-like regulatory domain-containing protein [Candidatus Acidoferrales bacterium]|jgi:FlaG/FlaF family flagellin (archaellin)|nr:carboxypeptidase-like regulatory domain-containing protein [Candidatus Acidoferrales bacterium]
MNLRRMLGISVAIVLAAAVMVSAQGNPKGKESQLRTVRGTVVDDTEAPSDSAVVYLKNSRTQDIATHLSSTDGTFRFSGLDLNVDYEIHAEKDGWTSSSRSISNFDTRKEFVLTLKLDHKKGGK